MAKNVDKPEINVIFSDRILDWFDLNGRHHLPWQENRTLYRIWVAEIMLQQTQVATVIPYYQRFLAKFPSHTSLAKAPLDEVLKLWAGLGYYTRARNLHKAAVLIEQEHNGQFPEHYFAVLALPGIGRSTAGAILAQALGQRHAILDGNVKRVLSRFFCIEGWAGKKEIENILWDKSEACTPGQRIADYTQAIMDLGATVCKRSLPNCGQCPLVNDCLAFKEQRINELPTPKPKREMPVKRVRMLLLINEKGELLLEKRPPSGIWGGLWSLPELGVDEDVVQSVRKFWGYQVACVDDQEGFRHTFSHYHLDIRPCRAQVKLAPTEVKESAQRHWCNGENYKDYALPAPVTSILQQYLD